MIVPPKAPNVRPTADRVREGICSALSARGVFTDARVLDLFAGTGALAFEAISRGALHALCVDEDASVLGAIADTAANLQVEAEVSTLMCNLTRPPERVAAALQDPRREPFTLVFADPPYDLAEGVPPLLAALASRGLIAPGGWVAFEHATRQPLLLPGPFVTVSEYKYGDTRVVLGTLEEP